MLDARAARGSSAGTLQYEAYCLFTRQSPKIDKTRAAVCHFDIGYANSFGIARVSFPAEKIWLTFDGHVVDAGTRILLLIDDMDKLGVLFNNLKERINPSPVRVQNAR